MKKLLVMILSLALVLSLAMLLASCNNTPEGATPCTEHTDSDGDRVCDVCDELLLDLPKDVNLQFSITDQDGAIVPNVSVTFTDKSNAENTVTVLGDANGAAVAVLKEGSYRVSYDYDVDAIGYYLADTTDITVDEAVTEMELKLTNNNPNGTAARPYVLSFGEENEITIPAGTSYYYIVYRAVNLYAEISGEGFKVLYSGEEYTPVDGVVTFDLLGADTNSVETMLIENTGSEDITISALVNAKPGTSGNPYSIPGLGTVRKSIAEDQIIYFTYFAESEGTLYISVATPYSYLSMMNARNSVVVSTTSAGSMVISLNVKAGDEIIIDCGVTEDSQEYIEFVIDLIAA